VGLYGELLEEGEQALVARWEDTGCAKVALKVDTEEDMLELEATVRYTLTLAMESTTRAARRGELMS
jgi:peptidyl-tRNA hydrolase